MIVRTIPSTLPAFRAKKDMLGKAEIAINCDIREAMNIIRGPDLLSSLFRMKIWTKMAEKPRHPMITPI